MTPKKQRQGLLQIYTGNHEHHNYPPVGLALRASGQKLKTHLTSFLPFPLSESLPHAAAILKPNLIVEQTAFKGHLPKEWSPGERHKIQDVFKMSRTALLSGTFDIVILAGIHSVLGPELISAESLMDLVRDKPPQVELVLTGTDVHADFIAKAHLVTEVVCHPHGRDERPEGAPAEVITGNGKGKTTYCLGKAMLMSCLGTCGTILQFIKSSKPYGEVIALKKFSDLDIRTMGEGFLDEDAEIQEIRHLEAARKAWEGCLREIFSLKYGVVVLDEVNIATHYGLVQHERVRELMLLKPHQLHLIMSGRNAHPEVMDGASTVIEMKEIKHPYQQGIMARKGIEF